MTLPIGASPMVTWELGLESSLKWDCCTNR